jgi:P-type conjugative transfer protein TrbJ
MRKIVLTIVTLVLVVAMPATSPGTGIPVIDFSNLTQNIVTALHQVMAYTQQVSQYQLQLQQYANQVKNTVAPVAQVWQAAQQTMNGVLGTVSMFQNGSQLQNYLNQYQNVNYWLSAPPSAYTYQTAGSVAQKQANDAMVKGIVQQEAQIRTDAANLERLQSQAGSADGQMKALDGRESVGRAGTGTTAADPRVVAATAASSGGPECHAGERWGDARGRNQTIL